MKGIEYERLVIESLEMLIEKNGLHHMPIAIKAWPDKKGADVCWRSCRNKTRRLNIGDAYDLAQAIGVSFLDLIAIVQANQLKL